MLLASSLSLPTIAIIAVLIIAAIVIVVVMRRRTSGTSDNSSISTAAAEGSAVHSGFATAPIAAAPVSAEAPGSTEAPGSAGEIKLYNVPDKQAAMVMAIVADHLKTPLNRLRFVSIRQVD